jgi:hypothetical protein
MADPLDRLWQEADQLGTDEQGAAWLAGWSGALIFARRYPTEVDALERRLRAISEIGSPPERIEAATLASEALADDLAAGLSGRRDVLN